MSQHDAQDAANPEASNADRAHDNQCAPDGEAALEGVHAAQRTQSGVSDSLPTDAETMKALAADMRAFIAGGRILP